MNTKEDLIKQALDLIASGEKVLETASSPAHSKPVVNEVKFHEFRIASLSYLSRVFGNTSTHYESFKTEVTHATASRTKRGVGILLSGRKELEGDWLNTTTGTITKDILTGFLRQAARHYEDKNFQAAAIIAGGVIDELLKNLCLPVGIKLFNEAQGKAVVKKSLQLTGEAYKKKVYDRKTNKTIIGWLELCDDAVTGTKIDNIDSKVKQLLSGVQSFLTKAQF